MKQGVDRVGSELCAVQSRRGKSTERLRDRFRGEGAGFGNRAAAELFGQEGSARNGCGAPTAQEPGLLDAAVRDSRRELQDIAANGIAYFDRGSGIGQLAGVARIAEMIENSFAEHH